MIKSIDLQALRRRLLVCALLIIAVVDCAAAAVAVPADSINWFNYEKGMASAKKTGKPVFLFLWGTSCGYCTKMRQLVFPDTAVIRNLNSYFTPIMVETSSKQEIVFEGVKMTEADLAVKKFGARRIPMTWFLEPDGCRILKLKGYRPASDLLTNFEDIRLKKYGKCANVPIEEMRVEPKPPQPKQTP
jgi:thioredoxin-related protein